MNLSKESPRILIAGAAFDTNNMGVGALAASAVKCALSAYPNARIAFLDYGKERKTYTVRCNGSDVSVPLVNLRFSKRLFLPNNIALLLFVAVLLKFTPRKIRKRIISRFEYLAEIQQADLVAGVCGGDSFSDIYGLTRLLYVTLPLILCQVLGRPVILLPQTYGPFRSRPSRLIACSVIRNSERAFARDHTSRNVIDEIVGTEVADRIHSFCYDMAFVLDSCAARIPDDDLSATPEAVLVGLNVSGLLWMGGYSGKNMFGLRSDYKRTICDLIRSLLKHPEVKILLVPHVFGNDPNSESDVVACAQVLQLLKAEYPNRISAISQHLDQNEVKNVIGQCDFFIGSRMHACIAALSQCIPSVPIAYSDKFAGVMQTIGPEVQVVEARQSTTDEIINLVDQRFTERDCMRSVLMRRIPEVQQTVLTLFGGIFSCPKLAPCEPNDSMMAANV